jgi:hypothetical protein
MTRPRYESPEDLANEIAVINRLSDAWTKDGEVIDAIKLEDEAAVDWMLLKMKPEEYEVSVGFVEIKTRDFVFGQYASHYISHLKWVKMLKIIDLGFDLFVVFNLLDGVYWYKVEGDEKFLTKVAGRTDRGDPADQERIVHIPKTRFRRLST